MNKLDLKNKVLEIIKEDNYYFDNLCITQAVDKLKGDGINCSRSSLTKIFTQIIPNDGLQINDSLTLHMNTPEGWGIMGLRGTPQYCFQVM